LVQNISRTPLGLYRLQSAEQEGTNRVVVRAHLKAAGRHEEILEQIVTRLSLEPGVSEASGVADSTIPDLEEQQA
jgi:putative Mg2+ transporter-C (MgtC) family protein